MAGDPTLLKAALDALPEPILVWTPQGTVALANSAFAGQWGLSKSALEGFDADGVDAALLKLGREALPPRRLIEGRPLTMADERLSVPLVGGGRLDLFRPSTEKALDPRRRQEFWAIASHDIRGALGNVTTYAGLLLSGRLAELEPRVRRSIEVIARNADRALRLVQSCFDVLRARTGHFSVHAEAAALDAALRGIVASRELAAAEKQVRIVNRVEALPLALFDRERGMTAIGAFLDNAIEREADRGEVSVSCRVADDAMTLEFADHGATLSADEAEGWFDSAERALAEKRLGTGFSMAVARAVARIQGGDAGIERRNGGTVFTLRFRRAEGARQEAPAEL